MCQSFSLCYNDNSIDRKTIKYKNFVIKKIRRSMGQEKKYMDEYIKEISEKIEDKKEYYAEISDKIWKFAEPRFQEYKSSELLQQ